MLLEQHLISEKVKRRPLIQCDEDYPNSSLFYRVAPSKNIFLDSDILMKKTTLSDEHLENFHSSGI